MQGIDAKKILKTADDCICDLWVGCSALEKQ
jgi:hypothetical protein